MTARSVLASSPSIFLFHFNLSLSTYHSLTLSPSLLNSLFPNVLYSPVSFERSFPFLLQLRHQPAARSRLQVDLGSRVRGAEGQDTDYARGRGPHFPCRGYGDGRTRARLEGRCCCSCCGSRCRGHHQVSGQSNTTRVNINLLTHGAQCPHS